MKIYKPDEKIPEGESFAYITAKGGHYLFKRNCIFNACVRIDEIPDLPEQKEYIELKTPKIPLNLLEQALAFFQKVYEKHKSEAIVLLTYENDQWGIYAPLQIASLAGVEYKNDENRRVVGSIHSHPQFSSSPSYIDECDEINFDGVHIIAGDFVPLPQVLSVFAVVNGRRFRLKPKCIIEGLERKDVAVNKDWLKKVRTRKNETIFNRAEHMYPPVVSKEQKAESKEKLKKDDEDDFDDDDEEVQDLPSYDYEHGREI